MKNLSLTFILSISLLASYGQSFSGVFIGSDLAKTVLEFKAKGFKFKEYIENGAILTGSISRYNNVELYLYATPKTKKVARAIVYLPEENNWYDIKTTFNKFVNLFTEKYGQASSTYTSFVSPYYDGDGYEMSAVTNEKCLYLSLFMGVDNSNYAVEISKFKQVKLSYENVSVMELLKKETSSIESSSF